MSPVEHVAWCQGTQGSRPSRKWRVPAQEYSRHEGLETRHGEGTARASVGEVPLEPPQGVATSDSGPGRGCGVRGAASTPLPTQLPERPEPWPRQEARPGPAGTHVFPAQRGLAVLAVDVGHGVQPRQQDPLLGRAAAHVHPVGTVWGAPEARPCRGGSPQESPSPTSPGLTAPSVSCVLTRS